MLWPHANAEKRKSSASASSSSQYNKIIIIISPHSIPFLYDNIRLIKILIPLSQRHCVSVCVGKLESPPRKIITWKWPNGETVKETTKKTTKAAKGKWRWKIGIECGERKQRRSSDTVNMKRTGYGSDGNPPTYYNAASEILNLINFLPLFFPPPPPLTSQTKYTSRLPSIYFSQRLIVSFTMRFSTVKRYT